MSASDDEATIESSRAPLMDHLVELRRRLITCAIALAIGFGVCFYFAKEIYLLLLQPFEVAATLMASQKATGVNHSAFDPLLVLIGMKAGVHPTEQLKLVFTAPLEFFFTKVKLAGFGAVILTFPVTAWQLYRFVAPGLYKRERRAFLPFLVASPLLFVAGAAMVYFMIMPFLLWFSLSQQIVAVKGISVELLPKVSEYFDQVLTLLLAFGLGFQLPVILALLGMAGLVNSKMLMSGWRFAVAGVVVVAAFITPPDPISQILLSVPVVGLYFASVGCVWLIERGRRHEDDARDLTVV